jgi:hypothetical protein
LGISSITLLDKRVVSGLDTLSAKEDTDDLPPNHFTHAHTINPTNVKRTGDFSSSELANANVDFFLRGGRGSYEGCVMMVRERGRRRRVAQDLPFGRPLNAFS